MRLALLLGLTLGSLVCRADPPESFEGEDLRAIQAVFKKRDPSLDWFQILAKKPVDAANSLLLVEAAPVDFARSGAQRVPVYPKMLVCLFVVSGKANLIQLELDAYPLSSHPGRPTLDDSDEHSAYLHFYSDYGFYQGSIKYIYDLRRPKPPLKIPYGALAFTSVAREGDKLRYQAAFGQGAQIGDGWKARYSDITIEPRGGDSPPAYEVVDTPPREISIPAPAPLRTPDGQTLRIIHFSSEPPLQAAGVHLTSSGGRRMSFRVPVVIAAQYRAARPNVQPPAYIENDIGPFAFEGSQLWFANTFYDGEGYSGVGAIGSFDIVTHAFEMRYLPEIVSWSASALLLDGPDIWVGLMRRPEGATAGGGLLRYNRDTHAVIVYPVKGVINTIDRIGDTLYIGASQSLYTIRADKITQLRFEPDARGKLLMIASPILDQKKL